MQVYSLLSAGFLLSIVACSCAPINATILANDPRYAALKGKVLPNPPPDAIVGMWYGEMRASGADFTSSSTMLIRSDGTMITRGKSSGDEGAGTGNWTWKYTGNGCWNVNPQGDDSGLWIETLQTTGQHLLKHIHVAQWNGADVYLVYVRADDDAAVSKERSRRKSDE